MPLAEFIRFVPRLHERTFPLSYPCRPRFARLVPLCPVGGIAAPASHKIFSNSMISLFPTRARNVAARQNNLP